jgi:hypothetical protein
VMKEYRGEESLSRFVRDRSGDSLMAASQRCAGESDLYRRPENLNDGWMSAGLAESRIDSAPII